MGRIANTFFAFTFCSMFAIPASAQFIWNEQFPYGTSGDLTDIGSDNWSEFNPGDPINIQLASGSLTFTNYSESGLGNKITLNGGGQGAVRSFGPITPGKVYLSFMTDITLVPDPSQPLAFFFEADAFSAGAAAMLYVVDDGSGDVQFALRKTLNSVLGNFSSSYPTGTFLIVISYEYTVGSNNDTVKAWINPDLSGPEPLPTIKSDDFASVDGTSLAGVVFQANDGITASIAGVRVGQAWSDAPLPVQLTNFAATSSRFGVDLRWSTETELNNYGFDVERRKISQMSADTRGFESGNDGVRFASSEWQSIGFVQGAGTSTSPREYSYTDANVEPGRYAYRIKQIDMNGAFTYYSAAEVEVGIGPKELALEPNYPNPFNPSTNITFTVPVDGRAALKVYNMLGQEVATLFDEEAVAGRVYQKTFDASSLPTGVYVSRLEFGGQSVMRKMLFVK